MSPEENKALVRRFYAEIDKGNIDAMDELVTEDYLLLGFYQNRVAGFPRLIRQLTVSRRKVRALRTA